MRMRWLRPQYLLRGRLDLAGERPSGRSGSKSTTTGATVPLRRSYLWAVGTALILVLLHLLLLPTQVITQCRLQALVQILILESVLGQALQGREFLQALLQHVYFGTPVAQAVLHGLVAPQFQFIQALQPFFHSSAGMGQPRGQITQLLLSAFKTSHHGAL